MPRLKRFRLRLRRPRLALRPARRRMRETAIREMEHLGVHRARYLLMLPLLLAFIALAAYWRVPRATVRTFQPVESPVTSPLGGWAADATLDPAEAAGPYSFVWAKATWRELEPAEGEYAFEALEERIHLAEWRARGCRLILRVVLDCPGSGWEMDIPEWLWEKTGDGATYDLPTGRGYAPDYSNLTLQTAHLRLLQAIAQRWAESGDLAFVEMGSLGRDGLWEQLSGAEGPGLPMADVAAAYIWQYATAFPETVVLAPKPYREAVLLEDGAYNAHLGNAEATWDWVNLFSFGGWDEDIGENLRPAAEFGLSSAAGAWVEEGIDLGALLREDADSFRRMALECRPTYICLADDTAFLDESAAEEMENIAREVGSRLWVRQASWPWRVRTDYSLYVDLTVRNDGVAPPAEDWPACLCLMREGEVLWQERMDVSVTNWLPGDTALRVRITVPADFAMGQYELAVALCDPRTGEPAVPLAMDCETRGLWHVLGMVTVV